MLESTQCESISLFIVFSCFCIYLSNYLTGRIILKDNLLLGCSFIMKVFLFL